MATLLPASARGLKMEGMPCFGLPAQRHADGGGYNLCKAQEQFLETHGFIVRNSFVDTAKPQAQAGESSSRRRWGSAPAWRLGSSMGSAGARPRSPLARQARTTAGVECLGASQGRLASCKGGASLVLQSKPAASLALREAVLREERGPPALCPPAVLQPGGAARGAQWGPSGGSELPGGRKSGQAGLDALAHEPTQALAPKKRTRRGGKGLQGTKHKWTAGNSKLATSSLAYTGGDELRAAPKYSPSCI